MVWIVKRQLETAYSQSLFLLTRHHKLGLGTAYIEGFLWKLKCLFVFFAVTLNASTWLVIRGIMTDHRLMSFAVSSVIFVMGLLIYPHMSFNIRFLIPIIPFLAPAISVNASFTVMALVFIMFFVPAMMMTMPQDGLFRKKSTKLYLLRFGDCIVLTTFFYQLINIRGGGPTC